MNRSYSDYSTCDYADALPREQFMDYQIHSLWQGGNRLAGPAFTVKCAPGDHLMLHAAIYQASPGDIIVVEADDRYALAGGNVCAIAQKRGIAGFILDGTIRDIAEIRALQFPVYARGVVPKPGAKKCYAPLNQPVMCGGVRVEPGDIVVADEDGIAVIPKADAQHTYEIAKARYEKDASMSLEEWQLQHESNVQAALDKIVQA